MASNRRSHIKLRYALAAVTENLLATSTALKTEAKKKTHISFAANNELNPRPSGTKIGRPVKRLQENR